VRAGGHYRHLARLWLIERVDDGKFRQLVLLFLLISGATLII